jgi:hypothetical protein
MEDLIPESQVFYLKAIVLILCIFFVVVTIVLCYYICTVEEVRTTLSLSKTRQHRRNRRTSLTLVNETFEMEEMDTSSTQNMIV